MSVAYDYTFDMQFHISDGFAAIVDNVHVCKYGCSAHPDLTVQACSEDYPFTGMSSIKVFVR